MPAMAAGNEDAFAAAVRVTASRYRRVAPVAARFVGGKLRRDPVYRQLAEHGPHPAPIVDLGCGLGQTGLLLAALQPGVPVLGIDWDPRKLRRARRAADGLAGVVFARADIRRCPVGPAHSRVGPRSADTEAGRFRWEGVPADLERPASVPAERFPNGVGTVLLLDVLHYHPPAEQDTLLAAAAAALAPGGRLWLRDLDAAAGLRATATRVQERLARWLRWHRGVTLHYRAAAELAGVLERLGLRVNVEPSWRGTPFGNVLITAIR